MIFIMSRVSETITTTHWNCIIVSIVFLAFNWKHNSRWHFTCTGATSESEENYGEMLLPPVENDQDEKCAKEIKIILKCVYLPAERFRIKIALIFSDSNELKPNEWTQTKWMNSNFKPRLIFTYTNLRTNFNKNMFVIYADKFVYLKS